MSYSVTGSEYKFILVIPHLKRALYLFFTKKTSVMFTEKHCFARKAASYGLGWHHVGRSVISPHLSQEVCKQYRDEVLEPTVHLF